MKIKTSDLSGAEMDWAVAKCEGTARIFNLHEVGRLHYSTDWSVGGPILERELIETSPAGSVWRATPDRANYPNNDAPWFFGPTPLIAAMRCFVASKLGDEVDVPEELL